MSMGYPNGFLVLRDLSVDALVLDGVVVPDPKSVNDPEYGGSFRGYFDVPAGTHSVVGRTSSGKEHAISVVVHPGSATVKRFNIDNGWADDDAETERHYRHLAMSGSMQDAGALRPWPVPATDADQTKRVFGDPDFAWLRATFLECAGARVDSTALQRYVDALRWHYVQDSEMGVQAPYFARLGHELCEHVGTRPQLLATGAARYLDYFAVDLVDANRPETIEAGHALAKSLERARLVAPAPPAAKIPDATPAQPAAGSPLLMVALAVAVVLVLVLVLRRGSDTPLPTTPTTAETTPSTPVVNLPTARSFRQLALARKNLSLFVYAADHEHQTPLVDAAGSLEMALSKDDCLAARRPYDIIKETKVDLTEHTALGIAQIDMLMTVAAYCYSWQSPDGKRW